MRTLQSELEGMRRFQKEVAKKVILEDTFKKPITNVGGIDLAFIDNLGILAYIIVDYKSLKTSAKKFSAAKLCFPYISTLLSFREGPPIIDIINSVELKPEILFINAQGIAHPMLCGCASHVGVLTNVPTIGVASQNLCGIYSREPKDVDEYISLLYGGKVVGWALKSKTGCRPIFVSPGHRVSLKSSLDITMKCIKDHKLPEPLHLAHIAANEEKRRILQPYG
jgi:deoxyribonuclease V